MSILGKLSVKPLLYVIVVLLLAIGGLWLRLAMVGAERDTAQAQVSAAQSKVESVTTERDAWKNAAQGNLQANSAANNAIDTLKGLLDQQQQQCSAMRTANDKAVANARAQAQDADNALRLFTAKFQTESRKPDCAQALKAMEGACPALRDY
jgi:hypothetical protein